MKHNLLLFSLLLLIACQSNNQPTQIKGEGLKTKIDSILNQHNFNGVVLLKKDNTTIYSQAKGYSNIENKTSLKLQDQFVIGSISKQITAVLILRELEKGNIALDDLMVKYLPAIKMDWINEVNIHHLLTHTHGIQSIESPLDFEVGTQFQYSQLGYDLLAQILEKVSKKSFRRLSTEMFLQYNLTHTFHPDNKNYKQLVKGYTPKRNGELQFAQNSLRNYPAAGSFISNAPNLILWNQLLHQGILVSKESLALMKTKQTTRTHPVFDSVDYSYGLLFLEGEADIQIGALGYAPGFISAAYYHPKSKLNLVVLANTVLDISDTKNAFKVHAELLDLVKRQ